MGVGSKAATTPIPAFPLKGKEFHITLNYIHG